MMLSLKKSIVILLIAALTAVMAACSGGEAENAVELTDAETESLMEQVAESDVSLDYGDHLKDEAFAVAEVFGVTRDGDQGAAYAYLNEGDYVVLKDKAYNMSGSSGEVIIRFTYSDNGVTLSEVVWSDDGGMHEDWMKENYPAEYLKKAKAYQPFDVIGASKLSAKLREKAEAALGVPVESDNLLEIDTDKGTYVIVKTIDGIDGTFDTETVEQGRLSDLSSD